MKKPRWYCLCFVLCLLLAAPLGARGQQPLSEPALLRGVVPKNAVAYLRVPSVWGVFSAPKNTLLGPVMQSAENVEQVRAIESAVHENLLKTAETFTGPFLTLLLHHLRSPLEAVFLLSDKAPQMPIPNMLLAARLNLGSVKEITDLLGRLEKAAPGFKVLKKPDEQGRATLLMGALPLFLQYDVQSRTLHLMGGMTADQQSFHELLESLAPVDGHPMYAMEERIDDSRQGFFVWANMERLWPVIRTTTPPEKYSKLEKWGLTGAEAAALGWGAQNGKNRIKVLLDAPKEGYFSHVPAIKNDVSVETAGEPKTVAMVSVPALEWLKAFETVAEKEGGAEFLGVYEAQKEAFKKETGVPLEELLEAAGNQVIFFSDEAGEFMAVKVGDPEGYRKIFGKLVEKYDLFYETRKVEGAVYHHLATPSTVTGGYGGPETDADNETAGGEAKGEEAAGFFAKLTERPRTHLYWLEEAGHLVVSQVPQSLMDRTKAEKRTALQEWVRDEQKQDMTSALLFFSTRFRETPRRIYYAYLQILNLLADLAQTRADLFAMPTATELNLPVQGTYGLQLDVSERHWAFEWTFENNPTEFLLSQDMSGVMALGTVAAFAVPLYMSYQPEELPESLQEVPPVPTPPEAAPPGSSEKSRE